jgi:ElaB/YqjD/DUF883 family membrane-anchored ribosome-binding protein
MSVRPNAQSEDLAAQIDTIRADLERLTSTVARVVNWRLGQAQDKAVEQAEDAVRRNPTFALAIAFGVGFLFGVFTRR